MIRIDTSRFLRLLARLLPTATADKAGGFHGILLHTARGPYGDDPGDTTLLVGTSASGRVVGHTYIPCEGTLEPTVITTQDIASLRAFLAPRAKHNEDHAVEIGRDLITVTVSEPADLFDMGDSITLHAGDLDKVPRRLWQQLALLDVEGEHHNSKGDLIPDSTRTDIPATALVPFVAVARAVGAPLQLYRVHQHAPVLVQIGDTYRGVLWPSRWAVDIAPGIAMIEGAAPDADVHNPGLPPLPPNSGGPAVVLAFGRPAAADPVLPLDDEQPESGGRS